MDPRQITSLARLLKDNGDKVLNSEFKLTLSGMFEQIFISMTFKSNRLPFYIFICKFLCFIIVITKNSHRCLLSLQENPLFIKLRKLEE